MYADDNSTFHFFSHLWILHQHFTPPSHSSSCLSVDVFQSYCHLISPKQSFSSLVFLFNFPKSLTPIFSCHITPSLHQLPQRAILVSSLILLSVWPITFLQLLNLTSYPSVTSAEYGILLYTSLRTLSPHLSYTQNSITATRFSEPS